MELGVQVFRLSEESLRQLKKKQRLFAALWCGLVAVMLLATDVWRELDLPVILLTLGVVVVVAAIGSFSRGGQLSRAHRTWGLAIGPDVLRHVSAVAPPVEMTRSEVVRVQESPKGLVLETAAPARAVFVPTSVERYALARELLAGWRTPEPITRRGPPQGVTVGAMALGFLSWFGARQIEAVAPAAACAVVYLGVVGWLIRTVFREPLVPPKQRAILVLIGAIGLMVLVWRFVAPGTQP